jgi:hypothetical protein
MSSWSFTGLLKRSRSETEVLNSPKSLTRQGKQLSLDLECLPEIQGESEILSIDDIQRLSQFLPPRIIGTDWSLLFTTATDGFSLSTLYRKCTDTTSPTLLCIEDIKQNIFGALLSCPIKLHEHFYGTGESFLFTVKPEFRIFKWSGENQHFARGNMDSLLVGAGEGQFGLWLDSSLYQGRSQPCSTYRNTPLTPGGEEFVVKTVECWTFQ